MSKPFRHKQSWRIQWFDHKGKRRSMLLPTKASAEAVLSKRRVEVKEIVSGLRPPPESEVTLGYIWQWYQKHRPNRSQKENGYVYYRHLKPFFGELKLSQIITTKIEEFTAQQVKAYSKKYVRNQLVLLQTLLNIAHSLRLLTNKVQVNKPRLVIKDFNYLRTPAQIRKLLQKSQEKPYFSYYQLLNTALLSGMRKGELCGLKWEDVDLKARIITVNRSYDGPTKSGHMRKVPILDSLSKVLDSFRKKTPFEHCFVDPFGNPLSRNSVLFRDVFHDVCKEAGVPELRFHDLRHTFAAHWVMNGGDIYRLQKILGHSTITMTERYSHLSPHVFKSDYKRIQI